MKIRKKLIISKKNETTKKINNLKKNLKKLKT